MSGFFESFLNDIEKVLLPKNHTKEMQDFKRILALSVYWDRRAIDEEILFAIETIETELGIKGFSGSEIELIIEDFKDLVNDYKENNQSFMEDKKWLLESITNKTIDDDICQIIIGILKSDGHLTETEEILIDIIEKNKKRN